MASLIHEKERPRKPWRVDWVEEGRRQTRRFPTRDEARRFRGDLETGRATFDTGRVTLAEYLERWWRENAVGWQGVTRRERAQRIDRLIVPHIGHLKLEKVTRPRVRRWRAQLVEEGATLYATDRALQVLSAALGRAVDDDLIRENPCKGIGRLHKPVNRRRAATVTEVEAIRAAMRHPRDRVMVSLMAYAGLRPSEMRALRWEDVTEKVIVVRSALSSDGVEKRTKTGGERTVPVVAPVADDLAALYDGAERPTAGLVAPFHADHRNWTTRVWRPARKRAGVDVPPYSLRHTFASLLIAEGRNAWQVAHLMGHANPKMVQDTYGHLFAGMELDKARPLEDVAREARHAASISSAI